MKDIRTIVVMLETLRAQKDLLKKELDHVQKEIIGILNELKKDELEELSYEELKTIYKKEQASLNSQVKQAFLNVMESKKKEKYPQLKRPTYFPEIDKLDLSDEEKLRIDKTARKNVKFYMSEDSLERNEFGLSLRDLELLESIGVAGKMYGFYCPDCCNRCILVSEEDMKKHERVWELETIQNPSKDEIEEFDRMQYDYGCIYLECMDCDTSYEITNKKEFDDFEKHRKVFYKIVKKPDLSSENL